MKEGKKKKEKPSKKRSANYEKSLKIKGGFMGAIKALVKEQKNK